MKNKKIIVALGIVILVIIIIVSVVIINKKQKEEKIKQTLVDFVSLINEKKYEEMYDKVETMNMNKEDFVARNKNIYEGIDCANIKVEVNEIIKQEKEYQLNYHEKMYTVAGEVEFDNVVKVKKEGENYQLKWSSNFIFPQLQEKQKVRIATIKAKRGDILDRNNAKLATDGTILSAGIVPRKIRKQ